jgi:hypothetical protein
MLRTGAHQRRTGGRLATRQHKGEKFKPAAAAVKGGRADLNATKRIL